MKEQKLPLTRDMKTSKDENNADVRYFSFKIRWIKLIYFLNINAIFIKFYKCEDAGITGSRYVGSYVLY